MNVLFVPCLYFCDCNMLDGCILFFVFEDVVNGASVTHDKCQTCSDDKSIK